MRESEIDYARRRTAEELDRADRCDDPDVAQVHRRIAVLYANMVAELHRLAADETVNRPNLPPSPPMQVAQPMPMPDMR